MILFIHGVPDTPEMWKPLISALDLSEDAYRAPALPGFTAPAPRGFTATKDAYADWLVSEIEAVGEPVNIVGHDWGALLATRAACLRPDLIESWCIANAVVHLEYRWHSLARQWQTPLLGEFIMSQLSPKRLEPALADGGLPPALAHHEAAAMSNKSMRQCILKLYRSAKHVGQEWQPDLHKLPARGLVFWGADDPYVELEYARRFSDTQNVPLHIEQRCGHWSIVERAPQLAACLQELWQGKAA